jgi:F0F1-type ATP synthase membrane subunit b/b'
MQCLFALGVLLSGGSVIDLDASLFIQMGIFFTAFFILKSLVFKPTLSLFDAREAAIDGAKEEALRLKIDAEAKRGEFESKLREASAVANEEREKARAEAQKLARELTEKARAEAVNAQKSAKSSLDAQAASARSKALAEVPVITRELTSKLLGRTVQ